MVYDDRRKKRRMRRKLDSGIERSKGWWLQATIFLLTMASAVIVYTRRGGASSDGGTQTSFWQRHEVSQEASQYRKACMEPASGRTEQLASLVEVMDMPLLARLMHRSLPFETWLHLQGKEFEYEWQRPAVPTAHVAATSKKLLDEYDLITVDLEGQKDFSPVLDAMKRLGMNGILLVRAGLTDCEASDALADAAAAACAQGLDAAISQVDSGLLAIRTWRPRSLDHPACGSDLAPLDLVRWLLQEDGMRELETQEDAIRQNAARRKSRLKCFEGEKDEVAVTDDLLDHLQRFPRDVRAAIALGVHYQQQRAPKLARKWLDQGVMQDPELAWQLLAVSSSALDKAIGGG